MEKEGEEDLKSCGWIISKNGQIKLCRLCKASGQPRKLKIHDSQPAGSRYKNIDGTIQIEI